MAAYLEQRTTHAAGWSRTLAAFSAVLFITAGLAHRYGFIPTPPFLSVLSIVAALAIAALALAAYGFLRFWYHGDLGGRDLTIGGFVALAVLTPFLLSGYRAFIHPQLNDISTDLGAPPMLVAAAMSRSPDMNEVAEFTPGHRKLQTDHYPEVTGRRYEMPLDRAAEIVETMLQRQGWTIATSRPAFVGQSEMTIEALAHTPWLGFPFDIAVRLTDEGTSTYVDMRSASRYGRHDLGDNAAQITAFLALLDAEMAAQTGAATAE
jgi:uncharacterized protein (DUF1499 family)